MQCELIRDDCSGNLKDFSLQSVLFCFPVKVEVDFKAKVFKCMAWWLPIYWFSVCHWGPVWVGVDGGGVDTLCCVHF